MKEREREVVLVVKRMCLGIIFMSKLSHRCILNHKLSHGTRERPASEETVQKTKTAVITRFEIMIKLY